MDKDYLQLALLSFNTGKSQWYGFKKNFTGEKRMSYENVILNDNTATMPTEAEVNAKIQELKDADATHENDKTSGKQKLKDLGLTDAEIKALTGA
jgi:hypothetical protein